MAATTHDVALSFEDGVTRFVRCREGQTVMDASYRSKINIPVDCSDGACGTCKSYCESGEFAMSDYVADALSPDEEGAGYVLTCSMSPRSDLVLRIPTTSAAARTGAGGFTATVAALERLSPTTMSLTLDCEDRDRLVFLPGQFVNIAVPGSDQTRSYSFSSAPDDEQLSFLVKLSPGGVMSDWLENRASVGDSLRLTGPHGSFFLRESDAPLLLLAGGTGLAPILSILRRLLASGSTRRTHLVYGATTDDDVVELETLAALSAEMESFSWAHTVADENTTAQRQGYVTAHTEPDHLQDGAATVYLCGPPPMVDAVRRDFSDRGFEPAGFYYEKFAPAARPDPGEHSGDLEGVEPETDAQTPAGPTPEGSGRIVLPGGEHDTGATAVTEDDEELLVTAGGRGVIGREVFPASTAGPLVAPVLAPGRTPSEPGVVSVDGYEIGQQHPSIEVSDAIFDARRALELGALELTIGRITSQQVAGYRVLAQATVPYVDVENERFTDAAAYTESNAAFHDHLFTLTGNEHLLHAYQDLGVKGHMEDSLRSATWCDPRCAQDHLDIVDAFEAGDRDEARRLISEHAERSKATTRRAMDERPAPRRPRFVTPGRFRDQVVVITGAGQGIGEATARRIHAEGGLVVLADRADTVTELAAELAEDPSDPAGDAVAVIADLETWAGAQAVVDAALSRFGRVDVAIHAVGGTIWAKPFDQYPPEEIQAEIDRSLWPTLWCCRAVAPHMTARGRGTIVNVSSNATRGILRVPYSAAKGGVNAITSALAMELAPHGVRVAATAPGGTDAPERKTARGPAPASDQERGWRHDMVEQVTRSSLMKRYGTLDEQAAALAFVASPEASYITGTVLPVAGGDLG